MLAKYVDLQVCVLVFAFHLLVCSRYVDIYMYISFLIYLTKLSVAQIIQLVSNDKRLMNSESEMYGRKRLSRI
jgi:hypothetical protein